MSDAIVELTDDAFPGAVRDGVVVVDFYGTYCPPCKMLTPVLERLAADYAGRARIMAVNVDDHAGAALDNAVDDIPTLIFFKNGVAEKRLFGAQKYETLAGVLDGLLS